MATTDLCAKSQFEPLAANIKVGLFGGSFNPAHNGHLHLAETARKRLGLDLVLWLVSPGNPLKDPASWENYQARVDSTHQRTSGFPSQLVCESEMVFGTRFTLDTVRGFQLRWPRTRFVWLIGADNLASFHRWRDWQQIAREIPIAVIARPGKQASHPVRALLSPFARQFASSRLADHAAGVLVRQKPPAWAYVSAPLHPASSTAIRREKSMAPSDKL